MYLNANSAPQNPCLLSFTHVATLGFDKVLKKGINTPLTLLKKEKGLNYKIQTLLPSLNQTLIFHIFSQLQNKFFNFNC